MSDKKPDHYKAEVIREFLNRVFQSFALSSKLELGGLIDDLSLAYQQVDDATAHLDAVLDKINAFIGDQRHR